jgi:chorismate-pyruvate lyase
MSCADEAVRLPGDAVAGAVTAPGAVGIFQRLIMSSDATVVPLLEACFCERIETANLVQETTLPQPGDHRLELAGDELILRRNTLLRGSESGLTYVHAHAAVVLDRLPREVRDGLLATTEPIGRLLVRERVESFRELLRSGVEPAGERGALIGLDGDQTLPSRTYRVISGGKPMMLITERFPPSLFEIFEPRPGEGSPEPTERW